MRLGKVDLNLFIVFDAIYCERSVTKVAALLNLTQPAVSNALSRLRQTFDDPLFVRTPQGMSPTPVADTVIGDVRKALTLLGQSIGASARFDPSSSEKVFRLAMNDLAEYLVLPALRKALQLHAPKVSISSFYLGRQSASEDLKSGRLDLLLDAPELSTKELKQESLGQLPYVVAMRPGHVLSTSDLNLSDYLGAEHLHVSSRRKGRGQVDLALHATGQKRDVMMRIQNYLVASRITEQTDLVWTVPGVLAETTSLHCTALPFDVTPLKWNLYWHKSTDDDPANVWLRQVLGRVVKNIL